MSTRANIIIQDAYGTKLWFYRHSDGYPEVTEKSLEVFMGWLREGKIRDNVGQAAGWLIILGHTEYEKYNSANEPTLDGSGMGWKVGAYEPTSGQHSDIEYLYTVDLDDKTLTWEEV
jgi:hypothetical protein